MRQRGGTEKVIPETKLECRNSFDPCKTIRETYILANGSVQFRTQNQRAQPERAEHSREWDTGQRGTHMRTHLEPDEEGQDRQPRRARVAHHNCSRRKRCASQAKPLSPRACSITHALTELRGTKGQDTSRTGMARHTDTHASKTPCATPRHKHTQTSKRTDVGVGGPAFQRLRAELLLARVDRRRANLRHWQQN